MLTEGILLRMLHRDPALEGTGLVVFDEFHERSLDADLGLALVLDARRHLRDDLAILVMSATLDGAPVARLLGDAPVIASAGQGTRSHVTYLDRPRAEHFDRAVVAAVRQALDEADGGILVFLPGGGEIRRVERLLRASDLGPDIIVAPLYGDLPQAAQDTALRPPPQGRRKIVLATSIAETSLTIEAIRTVIDGGLMRVPRYEPASGMTRLETCACRKPRPSSAAAAPVGSRRGDVLSPVARSRAGAARALHHAGDPARPISRDLALALARWGDGDPAVLRWLDPPPAAGLCRGAEPCLRRLGALDDAGRMTAHGRTMAEFGLPPRLAHMIVRGKEWGLGALACALAAMPDRARPREGRARGARRRSAAAARAAARTWHGPAICRVAFRPIGRRSRAPVKARGATPGWRACGKGRAGGWTRAAAWWRKPFPTGSRSAARTAGQFRLANGRGASLPAAIRWRGRFSRDRASRWRPSRRRASSWRRR